MKLKIILIILVVMSLIVIPILVRLIWAIIFDLLVIYIAFGIWYSIKNATKYPDES